ncbi:hypothetical protein [Falsirhodobacter halotolerans]|uniref:hypothetical protein n=1 Tax=Falsirhodobacter halotolerans TaxID=1146892 RepID=UPI001FD5B33F|nr:hypothetical protein [Falsirhodobacter halotolerans]MCJ8139471.1 hypothetical protein [Falsirhodobacter halotolerans]
MTKEIDQRAQRHDPASVRTDFPDQRSAEESKQPSDLPTGETVATSTDKYNQRDDGHSRAVDDTPLRDIKEGRGTDRE